MDVLRRGILFQESVDRFLMQAGFVNLNGLILNRKEVMVFCFYKHHTRIIMCYLKWKKDRTKIISWVVLLLGVIIYFIGLYYTDIYLTYNYSLIFLDCLKSGNILDFYEISIQRQVNSYPWGAVYFVPIYVLFAVWNFPVWILTRVYGVAVNNVGCLLWSKGIVILYSVGIIWILYHLLKKIEHVNIEYACFLFLSSLLFFVPALAVTQYDVINIFFMLYGIYFYTKDEKISWRVLLLFSIAISIKIFAIFPFIILVLVNEKRILYIIYDVICGLLFSIVTLLPWYNGYKVKAMEFNKGWAERLFKSTLPGGGMDVSVFALGFFIIAIVAYISKRERIQEKLKLLIWLTAAFFLVFFSTVSANPYWIIMLLPFLVFIMVQNMENIKINFILETALELSIILLKGYTVPWVFFSEGSFSYLIFKNTNIKLGEGATSIADILVQLRLDTYLPAVYAVFIVCGGALLVINNPWKVFVLNSAEKIEYTEKVSRFLRLGMVGLYLLTTYAIAYKI